MIIQLFKIKDTYTELFSVTKLVESCDKNREIVKFSNTVFILMLVSFVLHL